MRCVMVTGGAGFIGSCLVRLLIAAGGTRVVNLDKLTYAGSLASIRSVLDNPLHEFVRGDVGNYELVSKLLSQHQPTAIVHLAAESHVDRSISTPSAFLESNVVGTVRLLDATLEYWQSLEAGARKQFRFVQVSTDEVYGELLDGQATEATTFSPSSPYSASKAAADHFSYAYWRTYGLPTIRTHSSNNYGPFQFPEKLIPRMITLALHHHPLPLFGDGTQVRDWIFVEDHCRALLDVLGRGTVGQAYNIGADCGWQNISVVHAICEQIDAQLPESERPPRSHNIVFVDDRPGHDRRYSIDSKKIRLQTGWRPKVNFESGLRLTVEWYIDNREWVDEIVSGAPQSPDQRLSA